MEFPITIVVGQDRLNFILDNLKDIAIKDTSNISFVTAIIIKVVIK